MSNVRSTYPGRRKDVKLGRGRLTPTGKRLYPWILPALYLLPNLVLMRSPLARRWALLLCAAATAAGCADAPMDPGALEWLSEGREWAAVLPPDDLPEATTWLPFLDAGPAGDTPRERVRVLERQADHASRSGDLLHARELRGEAARVAVESMVRTPDATALQAALGAVDIWIERVRAGSGATEPPALAIALDAVGAARHRAGSLLAEGDTTAALHELSAASEQIREWAPTAVALRMLWHVEARLQDSPLSDSEAERARHLVRSARESLGAGDPVGALQRAVYALQILGGGRVLEPLATPPPGATGTRADG